MSERGDGRVLNQPASDGDVWEGSAQRNQLRGFTRLRAILWPRSVRLVELFSLGSKKWYWQLRWALTRQFSGLDLHSSKRLTDKNDIFGETPILTVLKLLELAKQVAPDISSHFVDLGSGRGTTCLAAANLGFQATGFEKEQEWVRRACLIAQKLNLNADFVAADFLEVEWPNVAVYFTVGTAYSAEVRQAITSRWKSLSPESIFIVGDWELGNGFEQLWHGRLPVDWGIIDFRIFRLSR